MRAELLHKLAIAPQFRLRATVQLMPCTSPNTSLLFILHMSQGQPVTTSTTTTLLSCVVCCRGVVVVPSLSNTLMEQPFMRCRTVSTYVFVETKTDRRSGIVVRALPSCHGAQSNTVGTSQVAERARCCSKAVKLNLQGCYSYGGSSNQLQRSQLGRRGQLLKQCPQQHACQV